MENSNKSLLALVVVLVLGGAVIYMFSKNKAEPVPANQDSIAEIVNDDTDEDDNGGEAEEPEGVMEKTEEEKTEVLLTAVDSAVMNQGGTATFIEKDGKVVVTIALTGDPSTVPQPSHIHLGTCAETGDIVYPLNDVVDGASETTLDTTLDALMAQKPLALNVHKSASELSVYTACGDL